MLIDKKKIIRCLADVFEKDISEFAQMDEKDLLNEHGMDSLSFIRFIIAIEEVFDITVNDSDLLYSNFDTLYNIYHTLQRYFDEDLDKDLSILPSVPQRLKKCLILDCDNVLWKGIASEGEIVQNINFQSEIVELYKKGILICLCSKNDETTIKEVFDNYTDMPLKWDHVLISKVSWSDKVEHIKEIAEELNIGLDSMIFIDDSDYEVGAVVSLLSEVIAIKYNDNISIKELFDLDFFTNEGQNRTEIYRQQKFREKAKYNFTKIEDYNQSLQTKVEIKTMESKDFLRISELSIRTNQFNLSMKQYSEQDLYKLFLLNEYKLISVSASDIYGDMGLVGAVVIHINNKMAIIEAFMLSCRVIGRGFEYDILSEVRRIADERDCISLKGIYTKTEKNSRYENFYMDNGVILNG